MIIAAFDQAPSCIGWAHGEVGAVPVRGVRLNPDFGDNTARLGKDVRQWAVQFLKSCGAERVFFEQIIVRKHGLHMPTLHKQFRVAGAIETAAEMAGLEDEVYEVDIADWRREFFGGRRPPKNADSQSDVWKDMAKLECADRGWLCEDHNAAEACAIWLYGCLCSDKQFRHSQKVHQRRAELTAWNGEIV